MSEVEGRGWEGGRGDCIYLSLAFEEKYQVSSGT
jgi:hypothetical protein